MKNIKTLCYLLLATLIIYLIYRLIIFCLSSNISDNKVALISSVMLTIITAGYLIITYLMMITQRKANSQNFEFMQRQSEASIMPIFDCRVKNDMHNPKFSISNIGKSPAYDMDVYISCYMDYINIDACKTDEIERKFDKYGDEELYQLRDWIWYPMFPNMKKVSFEANFPIKTDSYSITIQYCNICGDYYSNVFWLIDDSDGDRNNFQLAQMEPMYMKKHKKINFSNADSLSKKDIPEHLRGFIMNYNDTVKYRPKGGGDFFIEDRGVWQDL